MKKSILTHTSPNFHKSLKKVSAETELSMIEVTDLISCDLNPAKIKELQFKRKNGWIY